MKRILIVASIVLMCTLASQTLPARAHQPFEVPPYHIEVGWENEPPVTWQQNAIEILVTNASSGAGITGLAGNLTLTLTYAGQSRTWSGAGEAPNQIRTTDTNGTYHASVILTQPGSYSAVLTGVVGHTHINLNPTADANLGFERVGDGYVGGDNGPLFPSVSPSPSPTAIQASVTDVNNRAMLMGYVGIGLSIIGIGAGTFALVRSRSPEKGQTVKKTEDARVT